MYSHKSAAKTWRKRDEDYGDAQDVHKLIDNNWDNVVIEIIARYPDKIKGVEADKLFMNEREIEAIAFYDSYRNGLNQDPGGNTRSKEQRRAASQCMMGKQNALGVCHTEEAKANMSAAQMGHNNNAKRRKPITATKAGKTWNFESVLVAEKKLEVELGTKFGKSAISKACRGKFHGKHTYKGIHFIYD